MLIGLIFDVLISPDIIYMIDIPYALLNNVYSSGFSGVN